MVVRARLALGEDVAVVIDQPVAKVCDQEGIFSYSMSELTR